MNHGAMPLAVGKKKGATVLKNQKCEELLRDEVAGAFTTKQVPTHGIRTHINSTNDQVLKNYLSFIEEKRQHRGNDETISHKTCFFSCSLIH